MKLGTLQLGKAAPPIGVDLGRHGVRLVQLDRPGPAGRVATTARQPMPAGVSLRDEGYHQWVTSAVKSALEQGQFVGRRCVSVLPSGSVEAKNLRLPRMPADELRDAVAWEMRDRLGADGGELFVQFIQAGEVRQGDDVREEVIALAARTAFVEEHVDSLVKAGLAPTAVDVSVTALTRAFAQQVAEGVHVLLDVGHESSKIVVVRDGRVVFFKQLEVAGQAFDRSVAQHVSMPIAEAPELRRQFRLDDDRASASPEQRAMFEALRAPVTDLSREVDLCLRYFGVTFRGERPRAVTLIGGESLQPWLPVMFAESSGLSVQVGDPTAGVLPDAGAGWSSAIGAAARADLTWGERRRAERAAA